MNPKTVQFKFIILQIPIGPWIIRRPALGFVAHVCNSERKTIAISILEYIAHKRGLHLYLSS